MGLNWIYSANNIIKELLADNLRKPKQYLRYLQNKFSRFQRYRAETHRIERAQRAQKIIPHQIGVYHTTCNGHTLTKYMNYFLSFGIERFKSSPGEISERWSRNLHAWLVNKMTFPDPISRLQFTSLKDSFFTVASANNLKAIHLEILKNKNSR